MTIHLQLILAALVSFISVEWIYGKILKIAKQKGLVDSPDARKLQTSPVPVLGGIAVFFGLVAGILLFSALTGVFSGSVGTMPDLLPVLMGAILMLYIGSMDDILGLSPFVRMVAEAFVILCIIFSNGVCIDSLYGMWGVWSFSWWIAVPLTVFAGVGIINAYNMVDGVNGLSSGLCIMCSCIVGVICWKRLDYAECMIALCYAAALFPFFLHNVFGKKSRMYIGDGGTMVMGLIVTWFVINVLNHEGEDHLMSLMSDGRQMNVVAMVLAVTSVPVFDTLRVIAVRVFNGRSPFSADRSHLHHSFVDCGVSHFVTTMSEIVMNLAVLLAWYVSYRVGMGPDAQFYVVAGCSVLLIWGSYFLLRNAAKTHDSTNPLPWVRYTHFKKLELYERVQNFVDRWV